MNTRKLAALAAALGACGLAPDAQAEPVDSQPVISPAPAPPPAVIATPTPAPPPSGLGNPLAQAGSPVAGPAGLPDLSAYPAALLLGQNPAPAAPTPNGAAILPPLNGLYPEYLLPLNVTPAAPGAGTAAPTIGPNEDIPGNGRIAYLRRTYQMYQAGLLKGALLGQNPPGELPVANRPADRSQPVGQPLLLPADTPLPPPA